MENFQIIKYKKGRNCEYEVVPSSWVIGTKCFYPLDNVNKMIQDPASKPDVSKWLSFQMLRTKRVSFEDYLEAVDALYEMMEESLSDTEVQANDDNQWQTKSKENTVSQQDESKLSRKIFTEMKNEPGTPDNCRLGDISEYDEPGNQLSQENTTTTTIQSEILVNNVGTISLQQQNFTPGEKFMIGQLQEISTKLIYLTDAVNMIMRSIETTPNNITDHPKNIKIQSNNSKMMIPGEKLIRNEASLKQFEEQTDEQKRQLRSELLMRIGRRQPTEIRSSCLELSDLLICHDFWQYTSWAGGTKDEKKPKFALQNHQVFLNFFKDIIRETTNNACFSDRDFATFFQSKMKNRNQVPSTFKRAASRKTYKRKKFEISDNGEKHKRCDDSSLDRCQ